MAGRSSTIALLTLFWLFGCLAHASNGFDDGGGGGGGGSNARSSAIIGDILKPVKATNALNTKTRAVVDYNSLYCLFASEKGNVYKELGAVWMSTHDPCLIHACEVSAADSDMSQPQVSTVQQDCGQFYCDVDSELRSVPGSCCGECVRTKCRYNDTVYAVGKIWHNPNDCMLYECAQLADGQPVINAFERSCPPLVPANCPEAFMYVENCCTLCNVSAMYEQQNFNRAAGADSEFASGDVGGEVEWTPAFYRQHECTRECRMGEPPRTCHYKFTVESYHTLSKACYDCPRNASDCTRPHCIFADGVPRLLTVVNRMMPGPAIEVCEQDLIVVDVENDLLGESTTIHWHGLHQRDTPYMDGVPHITQCPISPHATFRYSFRADLPGTHFWHSHTGMQRGDGVFGAFIVRRPHTADPHAHLYDFDLSEHTMILQDWVHVPGVSMFADHHHSRGDNKPRNLLVNGRGRYYNGIWELIQHSRRKAAPTSPSAPLPSTISTSTTAGTLLTSKSSTATTKRTTTPEPESVDFLHPANVLGRLEVLEGNSIARLARLAQQLNATTTTTSITSTVSTPTIANKTSSAITTAPNTKESNDEQEEVMESKQRLKRSSDYDIRLDEMPLEIFHVRQGYRYRFRVINAEFLNCPIAVSVDNHSLIALNSDGYDFEAVEAGSIVTYAGERFDFVLHANQNVGNYWVRFKGLMDCSEKFTSAFQVAILRYDGAPNDEEPSAALGYQHQADGIELNAMNRGSGNVDSLTIAELTAMPVYNVMDGVGSAALKPVADYKFFVYYDFYAKDNPVFHPGDLYGFEANLTAANRLYTPQLNHISLKFPAGALLPARDQVDESQFCNETSLAAAGIDCRKEFCKCHHVLQVPLGAVVEFIIVDEGFTFDANHPFHLHGNAFRVVALERLGTNVTIEMVKQLDRYNLLKRNLVNPPVKDTVTVPDGGYTIVRFEAYNPGFWLFHCHIEFHAEIGMALVLKVGDNNQMLPVPSNFPSCNDYMPTHDNNEHLSTTATIASTADDNSSGGGGGSGVTTTNMHFATLLLLMLLLMIVNYT